MENPNGFLSREPDSVGLQKDIIPAKLYKDINSLTQVMGLTSYV